MRFLYVLATYSVVPLLVVVASQDCHCSQPILCHAGDPLFRVLDRYLRGGVGCGFLHFVQENSCNPTWGVVPAEDFAHCLEALVDSVPYACTGATEHVVLVLMLEAAAWAQSICCALTDAFLLVPDVQLLVHHF